jgi:hypothetical protein
MTASSLAIVLGHHIIRKKDENQVEALGSLNKRQAIFTLLIKEAPYLFSKVRTYEARNSLYLGKTR